MLKRARRGFTLLELIVVLVVLGIIALIAIPTFNNIIRGSASRTALTTAQSISRNANGIAALDGNETTNGALEQAAEEAESKDDNLQIALLGSATGTDQNGIVAIKATTSGNNNTEYACVFIEGTGEGSIAVADVANATDECPDPDGDQLLSGVTWENLDGTLTFSGSLPGAAA